MLNVCVIGKMLRFRVEFLAASGRPTLRRQFPRRSWHVQDMETQNAKRAEANMMVMITNGGSFALLLAT